MKTTTDQDNNGLTERQEQLIQQQMYAMLFSAGKCYHTPNNTIKAFGAV